MELKPAQDYINQYEPNGEYLSYYHECHIESMIDQARIDLIEEIIKMYVPDGNPENWLNKIKELSNPPLTTKKKKDELDKSNR